MKYPLLILAILGIVVSSLALREHYREYGDSPCSINERWDCGVVNHSPFAILGGVFDQVGFHTHLPLISNLPVATAGILGYILMGLLALGRAYRWLLTFVLIALGFSLYLANIEAHVLGVWCVYCVISLGMICVMTLLTLATVIAQSVRRPRTA